MAFFEGRRLTAMSVGSGEALSDLRVSPFGNFVGVRSGDGFLLLNARGDVLPAPGVAGYRAITWSPDEQWAAVAGVEGIIDFRPGESGSPELRLGFDAHELAWRGTAGPAPLASVDAARNWLTRAGMAGRLFVTRTRADGASCGASSTLSSPGRIGPPGSRSVPLPARRRRCLGGRSRHARPRSGEGRECRPAARRGRDGHVPGRRRRRLRRRGCGDPLRGRLRAGVEARRHAHVRAGRRALRAGAAAAHARGAGPDRSDGRPRSRRSPGSTTSASRRSSAGRERDRGLDDSGAASSSPRRSPRARSKGSS